MSEAGLPLGAREASRTPWLVALMHGVTASAVAMVFAWGWAVFAALLGASLGAYVGGRVAETRLRTLLVPLPGVLLVGLAALVRAALTETRLLASLVGPVSALAAADVLLFGLGAFGVSAATRALSSRHRAFAVFEALLAAFASTLLFVEHRHGAIHRPFEIADPMLAAGEDPAIAFLGLGALTALVVALLLLRERRPLRVLYHLLALGLLVLVLFVTTRLSGMPSPPPSQNGLGLREEEAPPADGQGRSSGAGQGDRPLGRSGGGQGNRRSVVAVVVFHDDYSSPNETYYLRQEAFSRLDGTKLVAHRDTDLPVTYPTSAAEVAAPAPASYERATVETTVAMLGDHEHPFGLDAAIRFAPAPNPDPTRFQRVYSVTSRAPRLSYDSLVGMPVGDPSWSDATRALYTTRHPDARYEPLARRIVDEMLPPELRDEPIAQVAAVTGWLGREGVYSLRHRSGDGPDPASEFLFGDRIGFCVHFAHAAVHLLRSLGIPSRVGAGYAVPEAARAGGSSMLVSDDLGHAWPEVYVEGRGFMVADVYPERSLDPPPPPQDPELTRILGEMARGENPEPPEPPEPSVTATIEAVREFVDDGFAGVVRGLSALAALLVALAYATKIRRRLRPRFARTDALARAGYVAALDALSEVGITRQRGETREAFARRVGAALPSLARLTDLHLAAHFGGRVAVAEREGVLALLDAIASERARTVSRKRRLLGALHPFSFFASR